MNYLEVVVPIVISLIAIAGTIVTYWLGRRGHVANAIKAEAETNNVRAETKALINNSETKLSDYYRQEAERLLTEVKGLRTEIQTLQSMMGSMATTIGRLTQELLNEKSK